MEKKEVDLNYLLEYSKKNNNQETILNEKLLYLEESNAADAETVSTVNSYTLTEETALKGVLYDSSKAKYWIEILKYIFLGNRQNIIYPLHFRKNVKFIRKIFYIFFFCSMSMFLMWGAIIFLMIGTEETTTAAILLNKTLTLTTTPEYVDIEYISTATPTTILKPPVAAPPTPKKHIIRPVPRAVVVPPKRIR